jgi:hypothetical protein
MSCRSSHSLIVLSVCQEFGGDRDRYAFPWIERHHDHTGSLSSAAARVASSATGAQWKTLERSGNRLHRFCTDPVRVFPYRSEGNCRILPISALSRSSPCRRRSLRAPASSSRPVERASLLSLVNFRLRHLGMQVDGGDLSAFFWCRSAPNKYGRRITRGDYDQPFDLRLFGPQRCMRCRIRPALLPNCHM